MTSNSDRIRQARKARKISQHQVADEIGMPRSSYAVSEKTGNFSIDELKKIYKFLEIGEENETKKPEVNGDIQARFINRLDDDLKELKSRLLLIEKMLMELTTSLSRAEARQQASYIMIQYLTEELSTVPRVEKDQQRLIDKTYKQIEARLREASPKANK